jgi:predicted Fe-Mo cluster-binding NifX family protein
MLKIAFGTDDGKVFTEKHFGDSKVFMIYEFDNEGFKFVEKRNNTKFDEETHGSAKKASHITEQLKDIPVLGAKVFGPNITRIRKLFIPIITHMNTIELALNKLHTLIEKIEENLKNNNEENDIIHLKF